MLVEDGLVEAEVVGVEVRATEVEVEEGFLEVVLISISVVVPCSVVTVFVLFSDGEDVLSGQKVINRLTLSS